MGPVEVFRTGPVVTVYADGLPVQAWAVDEWDELLAAIKADDDCLPEIEVLPTGDVWLGFQYSGRHEILSFTEAEWAEFVTGVRAGEFDIDKLSGPATHGCGAGQAGAPTADGAGQAATGAGGLPAAPAPVAADRPLPDAIAGNRRALSGPDREGIPSAQGSGLRPSPATGAGGVRAASSQPAPVAASSGPNVASMNVPAGRPSPAPHQVIPPQEAGQPGPFATNTDVDLVRPDFLTGVDVEEWAREWAEAAWAVGFAAGRQATTSEIDVAREWAKRTAPLVPPEPAYRVTDVIDCDCYQCSRMRNEASRGGGTAEATGGVPTHVGAATGGWKAGPGLTPVSPGPAEPTGGAA